MSVEARRQAVELLRSENLSERRSCELLSINRRTKRYAKRGRLNARLVNRIKELSRQYPTYGYRRIWAQLKKEGCLTNRKTVYRIWRLEKLILPQRKPRKKRAKPTVGILPKAEKANQIWSYDFVFDQSLSGRSLKILTLVDEFTRECLALEVGVSIKGGRVREVLQKVCQERGKPNLIRSDNGSEFISQTVGSFLAEEGINPLFIEPGKPWQNGKGESFNGKLREELLSREWFSSVREAKAVTEEWRKHYNEERPHSSLGYLTPNEFRKRTEAENKKSLAIELV